MGRVRTLAHLSDLHFGTGARTAERARAMVRSLVEARVDHVIVSGDITHRGMWREHDAFASTFSPLQREGRLTVLPGNHDRGGDDVGAAIAEGRRVRTFSRAGVYIVGVDSTGPHNRFAWASHGLLTDDDLREVDAALHDAPRGHVIVVSMHHHPLPLPEESGLEHVSRMFRLPFAAELAQGERLLALCRGRCDLLLHGHRHVPGVLESRDASGRSVSVFNAGSTTELGCARVFSHAAGVVLGRQWLHATSMAVPSVRAALGFVAA